MLARLSEALVERRLEHIVILDACIQASLRSASFADAKVRQRLGGIGAGAILARAPAWEWERPVADFQTFAHFADAERPSARAALVLLFWGYFETRIERLHRTAMRKLPQRVLDDQLRRYSGIGSRLYDLYKIFFGTKYFDDLRGHGFAAIADLLNDIHKRRNEFSHRKPQAISEAAVNALVQNLKAEHEAWITVYNSRVGP